MNLIVRGVWAAGVFVAGLYWHEAPVLFVALAALAVGLALVVEHRRAVIRLRRQLRQQNRLNRSPIPNRESIPQDEWVWLPDWDIWVKRVPGTNEVLIDGMRGGPGK